MMPYADSLKLMADWYCPALGRAWGKLRICRAIKVYVGQTPVKALGVTDQHSQVQLYTEGPFDKVITLIGVDKYRKEVTIAEGCQEFPDVNFLCGHTLNELMNAEMLVPIRFDKKSKTQFNYYAARSQRFYDRAAAYDAMMQTAYVGAMLNIDTFNQPGVEEGKNATYALFGRKGLRAKSSRIKFKKA